MYYALPPLALTLRCPEGPLRATLLDALRFKGAEPVDAPPPDDALAFVVDAATPPAGRPTAGPDALPHPSGITVTSTAGAYVLAAPDAAVLVDPDRGRATLFAAPDFGARPAARVQTYYFFALALHYLVQHRGYCPLHAATLVHDETTLLLSAASRAGKTTSTLLLIENGWSYLTDDAILLHRDGDGGVVAASFRRSFSLTDDTVARFPALAARTWPRSPGLQDKRRVEPEAVYPGRFTRAARPNLLVVPERVDGPSRLTPLSAWQACAHLVGQSALYATDDEAVRAGYLETLAALTRQCRLYRLEAGPDLLADRALLAALVADA